MRRSRWAVFAVVLLAALAGRAEAAPSKCAAAKAKAAGKRVAAEAICRAKAIAKDVAVDPSCLAKAEAKFAKAFAKAERKADCFTQGDADAVAQMADGCAADLVDAVGAPLPTPVCGNGVVEPGETCDGNCPTCASAGTTCREQTGSAATCDVVCGDVLTCDAAPDVCCPFTPGDGGCGAGADPDCAGTGWRWIEWPQPIAWSPCTTVDVYGIEPGGSYLVTTCTPDGVDPTTGDPAVTSVVDDTGYAYAAANDDCTNASAIPHLAGWACTAADACSSNDSGGVIAEPGVSRLDVSICGAGGGSGSGRLFIWYNATTTPNAG